MIVIPRGWSVVNELDSLVLVHPRGRDLATIEYVERMRPLHKSGALVRRALAEHPEFACRELPELIERLTTAEGEFAALATLAGSERGGAAQRDLGFVFGDDFYARLSAVCYRPDAFDDVTALVRHLAITDMHALGTRRRRFEYSPPRGWNPLARGFVTDWFPPDFPDDAVHLTAYPANPAALLPDNMLAILLGAARAMHGFDRRPLQTPSGLLGEVGELVVTEGDARVAKLCVVLRDAQYGDSLEATARRPELLARHRDELLDVFHSVQPLPTAQELPQDQDFAAHSYWIE